jgi:hypothetical protein
MLVAPEEIGEGSNTLIAPLSLLNTDDMRILDAVSGNCTQCAMQMLLHPHAL